MTTSFETARKTVKLQALKHQGCCFPAPLHTVALALRLQARVLFHCCLPLTDSIFQLKRPPQQVNFGSLADCSSAVCTSQVCTGPVKDGLPCKTNTGKAFLCCFSVEIQHQVQFLSRPRTLHLSSVLLADCQTTTSTCTSGTCTGTRTVAVNGTCTADSGKSLSHCFSAVSDSIIQPGHMFQRIAFVLPADCMDADSSCLNKKCSAPRSVADGQTCKTATGKLLCKLLCPNIALLGARAECCT